MDNKSIVGDLMNFRGLVYAPMNENGVVFLFGKVVEDLNMYIEEIKPGFPDCIARRFNGKGWEQVRVEFEYMSSNFKSHKHDPNNCDIIVCWENDWPECPLEVIELKDRIKEMENRPIKRPDVSGDDGSNGKGIIYERLSESQKELFIQMVIYIKLIDDACFYKAGKTLLSVYSPKRAFIYVEPLKKSLNLWVFTGGRQLGAIEPFGYEKAAQKWGKLNIRNIADLDKAKPWLAESLERITEAVKKNEPTGWYSTVENIDEDE